MKITPLINCGIAAFALVFSACESEQKTTSTTAGEDTAVSDAQTISLKVSGMT